MNAIDHKLFAVCHSGHRLQVETLLAQGANPNALDETRQTPLMVAARHGHIDIIDRLIQHGADPFLKDCHGRNALHHAIETRQYDVARHLIFKYHLNPNELTYSCQDAISLTARNGDIEFMDFLFQNGAKPRAKALEEAILKRHVHVVRHLIENYRLDPNVVFDRDLTPFLLAAQVGDIHMLDTLVELGANPDHVDVSDQNALHIATEKKHHDMMRHLLVRYRFDPNARKALNNTALMIAANNGDIVAIDILLQHGANPDLTDRYGFNALFMAVFRRHLDVALHLLTHCSFDINQPCGDGRTVFLVAAANHDIPMLDLLAQFGANPHHCDEDKKNAIAYAIKDHQTVRHLITNYGVNPNIEDAWGRTPLFHVIERGDNVNQLIHLINQGANPHYVNRYGENAVHFAVKHGRYKIIRCLIMNFMVNIDQCDRHGLTPWLWAAKVAEARILHLLAMLGANPYHTDHIGRNALHLAAERANPEAVRYLINCLHFNPNVLDHEERSPLIRAVIKPRDDYTNISIRSKTIEILMSLGSHHGIGHVDGRKLVDADPLFSSIYLRTSLPKIFL